MGQKNKIIFILFYVFLFLNSTVIFAKNYADGEVIIKFKDSSISKFSNGNNDIDNFFKSKKNVLDYKKAIPKIKNSKNKRLSKFNKTSLNDEFDSIYSVKISTNVDAKALAKELMKDSKVEWAEPRMKYKKHIIPNDVCFSYQWYINSNSTKNINITDAWDITTGSEEIVIAVIDDGVNFSHEDINGNLWVNKDEIPNNGIDDDQNGFIDDVNGWNFYDGDHGNNNVVPYINYASNNLEDSDLHGTHVAGIISAIGNNSKGVAGITWKCKIMPVKIFCRNDSRKLEEAIAYAANNGADIINMSLGSENSNYYLEDVLDEVTNSGVICVASSGNENKGTVCYPARYSNCLGVASTDENDKKSDFSNYGYGVDISAPGENILSLNAMDPQGYVYMSGTSMSCPIISGVCGLILSLNPSLNFSKVKDILQKSAKNINPLNFSYIGKLGAGRVNVYEALKLVFNPTLNYFNVRKKSNNQVYVYWNFSKPSILNLSYKLQISSQTVLTELDNPILTGNNSITIPFELKEGVTYYCYLQAENTTYNIKTDIFKSSSFYLDVENVIAGDKKYNEDNTISANDIDVFIPKNTFNANFYINIENLASSYQNINSANKKVNSTFKKGQNIFSKYISIEAFKESDDTKISKFNNNIEITLKNISLTSETNLAPYYLNETTLSWEKIDNFSFDSKNKVLKFDTSHFSIFGIFAELEIENNQIKDIIFYPNPFKIKDHKNSFFAHIPSDVNPVHIEIFDISGKLLKSFNSGNIITTNNGNYKIKWDGYSDNGKLLASGVYFAKIKSDKGNKTIKIAILG